MPSLRAPVSFGELVLSACILCSLGACRGRQDDRVRPAPEHVVVSSVSSAPAPRTTELHVEVTVVQWLAVGWANVINVKLGGDLHGIGSLWIPVGDPQEKKCVSAASTPGAKLRLTLKPMSAPDAGVGGPYSLHVRQVADGGVVYWSVGAVEE